MDGACGGTLHPDPTKSFYETNAESYALATAVGGMEVQHREFAGALAPAATVLDLGCGAGRDLKALAAAGLSPIGLDYSIAMARLARKASGCPIVLADMRAIPIANATVDGIWATASLLHLSRHELGRALGECQRVLKPDGVFYASVKSGLGEGLAADGRYFAFYSPCQWRSALTAAGFDRLVIRPEIETRVVDGHSQTIEWLSSTSVAA